MDEDNDYLLVGMGTGIVVSLIFIIIIALML